ncbi:nucleotide-binding domain containing protein [Phaeobacter sp. C3_T13_0]|uniref:nucleotide-binding domain containing protein n=1 Tax=Phaeobacter cretensis TaxID=3342641 RepID=UPI0039BCC284
MILAGSRSGSTLVQIAAFRQGGGTICQIDPIALHTHETTVEAVAAWATEALRERPVLVHGSASPTDVQRTQEQLGADKAGALVGSALSELGAMLASLLSVANIVVAGGRGLRCSICSIKQPCNLAHEVAKPALRRETLTLT